MLAPRTQGTGGERMDSATPHLPEYVMNISIHDFGIVIPDRHASCSLEYRGACWTATTGISILGMFRCASVGVCMWWRGPLHYSVKTCQSASFLFSL